jgi:hypothetical protein
MSGRANSQLVPAATWWVPAASAGATALDSPVSLTPAARDADSIDPRWMTRRSTPSSAAASTAASTRFVIALCAVAVIPTRFPARRSSGRR